MPGFSIVNEPVILPHALDRMRQRRIHLDQVRTAWIWGTPFAVGEGCVAYLYGREAFALALREMGDAPPPSNVAAITNRYDDVITTYRIGRLPPRWRRLH